MKKPKWRAVELVADYWIILDSDYAYEYKDSRGYNLMFETKAEAQERIKKIKEVVNE